MGNPLLMSAIVMLVLACGPEAGEKDDIPGKLVYTMILNNFYGGHPIYEGEPYVAIDPDQPCPQVEAP